jgi:hypothetical protein
MTVIFSKTNLGLSYSGRWHSRLIVTGADRINWEIARNYIFYPNFNYYFDFKLLKYTSMFKKRILLMLNVFEAIQNRFNSWKKGIIIDEKTWPCTMNKVVIKCWDTRMVIPGETRVKYKYFFKITGKYLFEYLLKFYRKLGEFIYLWLFFLTF